MASVELSRTPSSAGNRKTWTFSAWVKRSKISSGYPRLFSSYQSNNDRFEIYIHQDDTITVESVYGSSQTLNLKTNRKFRDASAWYHIVVAVDTTQATASNRVKLYVNGSQETSFSSSTYMSQNENTSTNDTYIQYIGETGYNSGGQNFDGLMAHVHLVDGTAHDADTFGSTDSTTGIWKPKTSPSVSYGTNGFFLDFADSSAMGNDVSGNNNDLTVSGTITQTIDTPSNVFATFLPVPRIAGGSPVNPTFSNGNTTAYFDNAGYNENAISSLAMNSGKYYWEVKCTNAASDGSGYVGIVDLASYDNGFVGNQCVAYRDNGEKINDNTSTSYGNTFTSGDIIGVAFDASTGTIWFSKNGTWQNSATKSEIEAGTTTNSAYTGLSTSTFWHTLISNYSDRYASINFGNGYFGTTAVSSAGTNSGVGTFEYDVPSGYKALCTKSINEQEYS